MKPPMWMLVFMTMNRIPKPRASARRRGAALRASALVVGALVAAAPVHVDAGADANADSVRITKANADSVRITGTGADSVRITGTDADSVRITAGCEGPDREHIPCVPG